MKLISICLVCFLSIFTVQAQINKVILAHKNGNLFIARTMIDSLCNLPNYKQDAEVWYVKGMVYETIFVTKDSLISYINENPLKISFDAYQNSKLALKNKKYSTLAANRIDSALSLNILAEATKLSANNNYNEAIEIVKLYTVAKPLDTLGYLQLSQYAGKAKNYPTAKAAYLKLLDLGFQKDFVYKELLYILINVENNYPESSELLVAAKAKFPNDFDFQKIEINIALAQKKYKEAIVLTKTLRNIDKVNASKYLFNIGSMYQILDSTQLTINYYLESLAVDSENFESNYNLGGIYYELSRDIYTKINEMDYGTYQKIGRNKEAEANELAKKALPYFEKAWQVKHDDELKAILNDLYRNMKIKTVLK